MRLFEFDIIPQQSKMSNLSTVKLLARQFGGATRLVSLSQKRLSSTTTTTTTTDAEPQQQQEPVVEQESLELDTTVDVKLEQVDKFAKEREYASSDLDFDGTATSLKDIATMTKGEFEELLNSAPRPTLQRDDLVLQAFQKLFKTFNNKDRLKKQFSSSSALLEKFPNLIPTAANKPYSESELAVRQKHHALLMGNLGSNIKNVYKPHEDIINPPRPNDVTVQKLMAAGAHLGHYRSLWKHSTQPFIHGEYKDIHIIDLDKTVGYLKRASKIVEGVAENGGVIVFLGLAQGQYRAVREAAKRCNGYYVTHKWVPGTITNALENPQLRHEVDFGDSPTARELTPDENIQLVKPDLLVVLNPLECKVAIKEANQAKIPTIGIVDTNVDPDCVTYPIPANDDSNRSTNLICGVLARAGEAGYNRRLSKYQQYKKRTDNSEQEAIEPATSTATASA